MGSRFRSPAVLLFAGALLAPQAASADDATIDRLLGAQCAQCHGTNGSARGEMESLAGMSYGELYGELLEMKQRAASGNIMHRQAAGYTDDQLARIARYFADLPGGGAGTNGGGGD